MRIEAVSKEAALDLSLCFLREMKQDEAADTLEGKRPTVCQIVTYRYFSS